MATVLQPETIYEDNKISSIMSYLLPEKPIKLAINGKCGILMDEKAYDGLLETIRILQINPSIAQTLEERENGEFIDESELHKYV